MKAILCLLAVVCAVNVKSYPQGAPKTFLDLGVSFLFRNLFVSRK